MTARRIVAMSAMILLAGTCGVSSAAGWSACGVAGVSVGSRHVAVSSDAEAIRWVPSGSLAVVRLNEPDRRMASLRTFMERTGFYDSPAYGMLTTNPGLMQARIGLLGLAASVGMDGWTAVGHLLGHEAVAALYPPSQEGGQPGLLIVAVGADAAARGRFLDAAATAAGLLKGGRPDPATSTVIDGRTVFTAGELRYCVDGEALVISGDAGLVRAALGARSGTVQSMAVSGDLDAAEAAAPSDAFVVGSLDAGRIVRMASAGGDGEFGRFENPLGGFVFGGWADALRHASSALGWISDRADGLSMTFLINRDRGAGEPPAGFSLAALAGSVDLSSIRLPRQVASLSLGRDWARLFSDREDILTVSGAVQTAAFAGTMTTLMGNLDFTEDFLPRVNGPLRLLLERQDFSGLPYTPSPRLPSFALIAPLKGASEEMLRQRLMSGSQMAMSFINYDAAQKQQPGFLMGLGEYRGVTILKGTYPPPGGPARDGEPAMPVETAPVRYNFEPVVAVAGDHYLVATSMATMRSLIDSILDASVVEAGAGVPIPDEWSVAGDEAFRILSENRGDLVMQRMLEQDEDREQAERTVAAILSLAGMVDSIHASAKPTPAGFEATLSLKIRPGMPPGRGSGG